MNKDDRKCLNTEERYNLWSFMTKSYITLFENFNKLPLGTITPFTRKLLCTSMIMTLLLYLYYNHPLLHVIKHILPGKITYVIVQIAANFKGSLLYCIGRHLKNMLKRSQKYDIFSWIQMKIVFNESTTYKQNHWNKIKDLFSMHLFYLMKSLK